MKKQYRIFPESVHANLTIGTTPSYDILPPLDSNSAVDRLGLYNGTIVDALIIEMSSREIRYRLANNPEGAIRVIPTNEVNFVRHRNGTVETLERYRTAIDSNKTTL